MKTERTISRRQIFTYGCATLAGTFATSIFGQGCAKTSFQSTSADNSTGGNSSTGSGSGTCSVIPTETNGPYPADNSDRAINALTLSGIVRSDITSSLSNFTKNGYSSNGYSNDNVFSDGATLQIASLDSGSYSTGYNCSINVGIKA